MTINELEKLIDHEIQWLVYYGLKEDRLQLNIESNIYKDLRSIGYTKRLIPLIERCSPGLLTSNSKIDKNTILEDIVHTHFSDKKNHLTPLEVLFILYPDRKLKMLDRIKNNLSLD